MYVFNSKTSLEKRRSLRKESTPQERLLWSKVRSNHLCYKFRRQYSIGNYIADFFCSAKKLVVEIDGSQHFESDALEYDKARTAYFVSLGIKILRFTNGDINTNLEGVIMKIQEELES